MKQALPTQGLKPHGMTLRNHTGAHHQRIPNERKGGIYP